VPALEPVAAIRVVALPAAIDAAHWHGDDVDVVRIASDEALGVGATAVDVDDPDAIVEPEAGYSVALLASDEVAELATRTDWFIPVLQVGPDVAQGKVAGVPAKLLIGDPTLLVVQAAYVDELERRLGWR
jgi:hypothetical protein